MPSLEDSISLPHKSDLLCSPCCILKDTWLHPLTLPPCRRSSHFEESLKMMRGRWNQNRLETFTTIQSESAETLPENSEQREIKCAVCQKRSLTSDDPHQGQGTKGVSAGCVSPPLSQFLSFYEKKMILSKSHSWVCVANVSDFRLGGAISHLFLPDPNTSFIILAKGWCD